MKAQGKVCSACWTILLCQDEECLARPGVAPVYPHLVTTLAHKLLRIQPLSMLSVHSLQRGSTVPSRRSYKICPHWYLQGKPALPELGDVAHWRQDPTTVGPHLAAPVARVPPTSQPPLTAFVVVSRSASQLLSVLGPTRISMALHKGWSLRLAFCCWSSDLQWQDQLP